MYIIVNANVLINFLCKTIGAGEGACLIYVKKNSVWSFQQLIFPDASHFLGGGGSIAFTSDGNTIALGAPGFGKYVCDDIVLRYEHGYRKTID